MINGQSLLLTKLLLLASPMYNSVPWFNYTYFIIKYDVGIKMIYSVCCWYDYRLFASISKCTVADTDRLTVPIQHALKAASPLKVKRHFHLFFSRQKKKKKKNSSYTFKWQYCICSVCTHKIQLQYQTGT